MENKQTFWPTLFILNPGEKKSKEGLSCDPRKVPDIHIPVPVNKVLSAHSHARLCTYCVPHAYKTIIQKYLMSDAF